VVKSAQTLMLSNCALACGPLGVVALGFEAGDVLPALVGVAASHPVTNVVATKISVNHLNLAIVHPQTTRLTVTPVDHGQF